MQTYNYGAFMLSEETFKAEAEEGRMMVQRTTYKIYNGDADELIKCMNRVKRLRLWQRDFMTYFLSIAQQTKHIREVQPLRF